ncbi:MAG: hypothetical protein IK065_02805, partial [Neisseriaceae bacterium]|nr:hypothetical protein [Neisseriaceae bacterium]
MSIFKITASKIKEFFKWGDKADSAVSVGKEAKDAVENYDQDNKAENIKHGIRVAAEIGDAVNPYLLPRQGLLTEGVEPVENAIDTISGREAYLNNQIDQASGYYNHIDDDEGNLQIINPSMPNFLDKEDSKYNEDNNSDKQLSDQDNDDKKSNDNKQPELNEEDINKIKEFIESIENKFKGLLDNKFDWLPDEFKDRLGLNRNGKFHIYDPLVLDLDGDGIKSSTGWVKADDGLLVWDRNGDGIINNGSEIFGEDMFPQKINHTITNTSSSSGSNSSGSGMTVSGGQSNATTIIENDGFYALSQLDSNQDGVIDCNDQNFNQIKVWRDLNQDGISQTGELFTL